MYKTLEQQIIELWASRSLAVEEITFRMDGNVGLWTVKAKAKPEEPSVEALRMKMLLETGQIGEIDKISQDMQNHRGNRQ